MVTEGEPLLEVAHDKVDSDIVASFSGTLIHCIARETTSSKLVQNLPSLIGERLPRPAAPDRLQPWTVQSRPTRTTRLKRGVVAPGYS